MIRVLIDSRFARPLICLVVICLLNSGMSVANAESVLAKDSKDDASMPDADEDGGVTDFDGGESTNIEPEDNGLVPLESDSSIAEIARTIEDILRTVPSIEDEIKGSLADPSQISSTVNDDGGVTLLLNSFGGATLTLPAVSSHSISMSNDDGTDLTLWLPGQTVRSQAISDVALAYEEVLTSTHIVAYAKSDTAVRLLVAIDSSDAPTEFHFPLDLEDQEAIKALEDGRVAVVDGDNRVIAFVNAPWAYDSSGNQIPSNFRIEGNSLVLEVDHHQTTNYPVIADPDFNWGITSGTIYFSRYETEEIAIFGASTLMGYIAVLTAIPTIFSTLIGLLALTILAWALTAYYKSNTCLKIRIGLSWSWTGFNPFVNPGHYQCQR